MPAKLDQCVQDLVAQGKGEDTAWTICRAALGEGAYPEGTTDQERATAMATLGETKHPGLREAANLGNWLEARIHSAFTMIADDLFGEGFMTRDERIALSGAIGEALTAFSESINESIPQIYQRRPFDGPPDDGDGKHANVMESVALVEAGDNSRTGQLLEAALKRDNTIAMRIIEPGQGSSGFYPSEVLERDGPKVFTKGLQMFWNHQTGMEERERPEGDLRDLAAELVTDAHWDAAGPIGPGLYAEAQVFQPYQAAVNELAGHIGVSIRGEGEAIMTAEGPVIKSLIAAKSVDFVTQAGAGGAILELFESYRQEANKQPHQIPLEVKMAGEGIKAQGQELQEAQRRITELEEKDKQRELESARLRESMIIREARDFVDQELKGAALPDMAKERLAGQLAQNPPTKEGALDTEALATKVKEAVDSETSYLTSIISPASPVRGMSSATGDGKVLETASTGLTEAFARLTDSEAGSKIAAAGR